MHLRLPVDDFIPDFLSSLKENPSVVLSAEPGAGKTTRIPPACTSIVEKKIIVLQPRRIAAKSSAERIAEEQNWTLGKEVGYTVRFENMSSNETKILFLTEALLTRKLLTDPLLSDVSLVIFDEFHERSIHSDIALGLIKELQALERPDLKIVVMSATIDTDAISRYLDNCPIFLVPGKIFPIETIYNNKPQTLVTDFNFIKKVQQEILGQLKLQKNDRHLLVFLPGMSEIQRLNTALIESGIQNSFMLHGSMSLQEQHKTLRPSATPKVILSTNIAETSLTIDGVDCVIDTGLKRELDLDPKKLFSNLKMSKISRASADQRRGRAGRQYPGRCLRLWSKLDENAMNPFDKPEIATSDITDYLLYLYALGVSNYKTFSWFESPPDLHLQLAHEFLFEIGAVDKKGITEIGKRISKNPLGARLSRVQLDFESAQMFELGLLVTALLNEKDPLTNQDLESWVSMNWDSDLAPRIHQYFELKSKNRLGPEWSNIDRMQNKNSKWINPDNINYEMIHKILLKSFPDRLCRRRRKLEPSGVSTKGTGVELNPKSLVRDAEFFIALSGRNLENQANSIIDMAIPVQRNWITEEFSTFLEEKVEIQYKESNKSYVKLKKTYFRNLALNDGVQVAIEPDEISTLLENLILTSWPDILDKSEGFKKLILRLELARKFYPEKYFPEFTDEFKKQIISQACYGEKSLDSILEKDFEMFFDLNLNPEQKNIFHKEIPSKIVNTKGKFLNLNYDSQGGVSLELRIQDAFGWKASPAICNGKIKVRLILLGPNMRPLQMTQDLESFWKGTYQELRPALKAKYHRHAWPEDPTQY